MFVRRNVLFGGRPRPVEQRLI